MLFAILFFMLMSFFLSGSETALTAVNKTKLHSRAENDDEKAKKLLKLVSKPDQLLTGILIGNNIANIMLPTLVTLIAIDYGIDIGLATGVLTVFLIIFAEVLPKTIAATFSERVAFLVMPVIRLLVLVLKPVTYLVSGFTSMIIRVLSRGQVQSASISKEELLTLVDIATTEGTFKDEETQRMKGALDFFTLDVRDALKTHRMDIVGMAVDVSYEEARDIVLENHYSRYPVYKESMDNIVGVFHSKMLLNWSMQPEKTLGDFTDKEPLFVSETLSIEKLFKMMLKEKRHLAIVIDEYGGTLGIVSHEDIIEAMLGQEIEDETDRDEEVLIDELTDTKLICHGKLNIRRMNELFHTKLPEDEIVLAGFIYKEMGRIPNEGDTFEYQHLHFEIKRVEDNKLKLIEIKKRSLPE
ncbi:hemolysin [Paenibacillus sambharensis]|uniref:Hemolysin n=1 Tax=Paenibacillus sambharensis TaxID=1803190 RepID=A0A2W1LB93_9BACL|nr:CNNM domain-containing protein [Paenibacillus sambharensis]PZD96173.1 hemolysin [Paenibacillus sambharensis]